MPGRFPPRAYVALTCAVSLVVFAVTALVPAPPSVVPLAALICIGGPVLATWHLRTAMAGDSKPIAEFRRRLAELPEIEHPLGR